MMHDASEVFVGHSASKFYAVSGRQRAPRPGPSISEEVA